MADSSQMRTTSATIARLALLAGVGLTLAACQTTSGYDANGELPNTTPSAKPNFPVRAEVPAVAKPTTATPTAPPPAPVAVAPAHRADAPPIAAGVVESKPLAPPPPAPVAVVTPPPPPPPAPAPVQAAPPPAMRPTTVATPPAAIPPPRPSATGKVEQAQGSATGSYTVKAGQGLDAIAHDAGVGRQALIDLNDLKAPYALKAGEKLKTPGAAGARQATYIVAPGDTLFSIARRFESSPADLADINGLKAGESIRPGQRLTLPKKYQAQATMAAAAPPPPAPQPVRTVAAAPPPPAVVTRPPAATTPVAPPTAPPPTVARAAPPPPPPASSTPAGPPIGRETANAGQVRAAGMGKFIWPVKGRILSAFGPKADGQRNDGINIAAPMNTSVRAAASGEVIYAGDVLREYGNLVLIQHPDGFVTAYGYLAKVNVKMKDKVAQDQEIGQVGDTGGVTQPQLHFETRYARSPADSPAPPVDPMLVLPSNP